MILGIYWLSTLHVNINYWKWSIISKIPDHLEFDFAGGNNIIKPIEFRACSVERILVHLDANIPIEIPVVLELMEVNEDFSGLPPNRVVEFVTNFIPDVVLISQAPYRMGLVELEEVND